MIALGFLLVKTIVWPILTHVAPVWGFAVIRHIEKLLACRVEGQVSNKRLQEDPNPKLWVTPKIRWFKSWVSIKLRAILQPKPLRRRKYSFAFKLY